MKILAALVFSVCVFGAVSPVHAKGNSRLEVISKQNDNGLREKFQECRQVRDMDCLQACTAAGKAIRDGAANEDEAMALCNKEYSEMKSDPAAVLPPSDVLQKNHAWMPDVVGKIGTHFMPRLGYPIDAPGRADWQDQCLGHAKIIPSAFSDYATQRKLLVPGASVRFGKLQYYADEASKGGHRSCIAGEFEILQ